MKRIIFTCLYLVLFISCSVAAGNDTVSLALELPSVFNNHMVLQRNKEIKIWGKAKQNASVRVAFNNETIETLADNNGRWHIMLPSMPAGGPYRMNVSSGGESVTFSDVLIGDVFIAGGQSNMAFKVGLLTDEDITELKKQADRPNIRYYDVARIVSGGKRLNREDRIWSVCREDKINEWSAIATYFAIELNKAQDVPIGIIGCNHGDSPIGAWISPMSFDSDSDLIKNCILQVEDTDIKSFYRNASSLYNLMLQKILGYPIKGVLWYQGEANGRKPDTYEKLFSTLISDWRNQWNDPELPFIFAQLSAYTVSGEPSNVSWAKLRDAQFRVWRNTPHTMMVTTIDVGTLNDIHPKNKKAVGERFVAAAEHLMYGSDKDEYTGPVFNSMKVRNDTLFISFTHAEKLQVKDNQELLEFEICGSDNVYKPAKAVVGYGMVKLWAEDVKAPVGARYAWRNNPACPNLYNVAGFPAVPFNELLIKE
ncbi:sialate O-acetylesterase [Dysgonomonas sp. 520]|uniref:sialate O-acetylesterase n=1 Tax=Dysgonomonas sp. 520 TaxID=2302931 RepID=UPI0013D39E66|nr:sialate O-acetylesterase [Dysgonomonas sp. 520]NDW08724.1 hypothetical protein [Dysgonomonas sp. 520]